MKKYIFIFFMVICISSCVFLRQLGPKSEIIASSPKQLSIRGIKGIKPHIMAAEHCAKHGRQWNFLGGYPLGEPSLAVIYGYDCVEFK